METTLHLPRQRRGSFLEVAAEGGPMDPRALMAEIQDELAGAFAKIDWAEDEIAKAQKRWRGQADRLFHSFKLLTPREGLGGSLDTEFIYRGHVVEILTRVARGLDTRPATAAEICVACAEISLKTPLHAAAAGLYFRMWLQAFPEHPVWDEQEEQQTHYERLHKQQMDELEAMMRRRLADPNRRLKELVCGGQHHGVEVDCQYTAPVLPELPPVYGDEETVAEQLSLFA